MTDNIFVLKSLNDKQKQTRQGKASGNLYCCFVDFKKAFDTVPRGLLWQVLERVGIRGPILDCADLHSVFIVHYTCLHSALHVSS